MKTLKSWGGHLPLLIFKDWKIDLQDLLYRLSLFPAQHPAHDWTHNLPITLRAWMSKENSFSSELVHNLPSFVRPYHIQHLLWSVAINPQFPTNAFLIHWRSCSTHFRHIDIKPKLQSWTSCFIDAQSFALDLVLYDWFMDLMNYSFGGNVGFERRCGSSMKHEANKVEP